MSNQLKTAGKNANFMDFIEHLDIILEVDEEQFDSQSLTQFELETPFIILEENGNRRITFQPTLEEFSSNN